MTYLKRAYFWAESWVFRGFLWTVRKTLGIPSLRSGVFRLSFYSYPKEIQAACKFGVHKAASDPQIHQAAVSNLGWEPRRNEACEWAKHWLRYRDLPYKDRDIHAACEFLYQGFRK